MDIEERKASAKRVALALVPDILFFPKGTGRFICVEYLKIYGPYEQAHACRHRQHILLDTCNGSMTEAMKFVEWFNLALDSGALPVYDSMIMAGY